MTGWKDLERELDAWGAAGRTATFWWRDDDAAEPSPELETLVGLAESKGIPLALAVIPADARETLARFLAPFRSVSVLQHGYAHQNHAPASERKIELGPHRPFEHVIAELATGWQHLTNLFPSKNGQAQLLPVMVPPWNRIAPGLIPMLPELRFTGLSTWHSRERAEAAPGLRQVNTHIDLINWDTRKFVGSEPALRRAVDHLRARRTGNADAAEPTGMLTHHPVQDADVLRFAAAFLDRLATHPAALWISAAKAFDMAGR